MQSADLENKRSAFSNSSLMEALNPLGLFGSKQGITEKDFLIRFPDLLKHLKYGEIKKGKSYGIHFFDCGIHRVRESIRSTNNQGVWEAKIDVRHPKTNAWVQKEKSSTLFPIHWTQEQFISKLTLAFQNSKRITSYKYCGSTDCGIRIVFIIQKNEITCCYPLWE
nr:EndoU domain-containing protein [Chitinophagaceae bacterium]